MKVLLSIIYVLFSTLVVAQKIHYEVATPEPQTHYAQVNINIQDWNDEELKLTMPSWIPGSYLMREFAKSVDQVTAQSSGGEKLKLDKLDKNTWVISTKGVNEINVQYPIYCYEISVRTNYVDASHAYFNPASLLMYIEGHKSLSGTIHYKKHESFSKISTALPKAEEANTFSFKNFDHIVDCPAEIGNHKTFSFNASGVKHTVAMYGKGNYEVKKLKKDMAKIVNAATEVFGENPNDDYLFIIQNLTDGSGGLEHINSTTLQVNRWTYEGSDYKGFLSLVAHEYFHLWNVKRLKPEVLGPFNYDQENYTNMLWVMEGFTSYYDELLMYRAGFYSQEKYLSKLMGTINYVEGLPGNNVQPVASASFDAWIKAYRPNENSANTTISYYSKGSILAALLDIKIIEESDGKKHLDDFLQTAYEKFYKKDDDGFKEEEFKNLLREYTGSIDSFYEKYVFGTEQIPYEKMFKHVGITLKKRKNNQPYLGLRTSNSDGKWIVRSVRRNGSAYSGGINANDEIIGIDGWRYSSSMEEQILKNKKLGDQIEFIVNREQQLEKISFDLNKTKPNRYQIDNINMESKMLETWLTK